MLTLCLNSPFFLFFSFPANVVRSDSAAERAEADHSGNLQGDHVGERQGGGGAGVRLGRQEHRPVHPQEAGELLG